MRKRPQKPPTPPEERPPRAEVPAGVRVFLDKVGDGEKAVGWAKNLSKGGMYIECKDGMTLDAEVSIQALARVGNTLHKIKLNGWVVHARATASVSSSTTWTGMRS
ncbi:MAG: hypothetical protein ACE5FN_06635 [Leptospirillia bacterium]